MGGTVSFAAENTVPGDALFTVKVHVNENVRGVVAVTSKAKAEWEVRLVERRLEEVEKLAMVPNVTIEVQQVAEQNLEHYSKRVKNRIEKFEEDEDDEDAMETASNLSEVLNAHEQVLVVMSANVATTTSVASAPVVNNGSARGTLKKVQDARGDAEKKHNELKEKYDKEKAIQKNSQPVKGPVNTSKTGSDSKKDRKQKDERKEEIRSTVNTEDSPTIRATEIQKEAIKTEDKNRVEANREESKSDDND